MKDAVTLSEISVHLTRALLTGQDKRPALLSRVLERTGSERQPQHGVSRRSLTLTEPAPHNDSLLLRGERHG